AVSLLIDESGSMSGTRIAAAMKMAMLVEDFTRGLQIPLAVTGHYNANGVHLTPYIRFDEPVSQNNKYRLSSMSAGGCNRDGFALRYCVKKLEEQDAASKIMIIISDGQPNAEWYSGATAKRDLQEVKKECERNGITLIAAAIGEDKDVIQNIYGNSFLDISDISELPKKIINLLKKQLI
ncbi:MAG: VWA domain-containing protein, partial [Monoglobaceae bacterium]